MIDTHRDRLATDPPATTTSCSTSTAACGSATTPARALWRRSPRCARPAPSVLFLTNDVRHAPEDFVRKLWRLGFQASLDEVVTVGAALQFQLAGARRAARRSWSARRRWSTTSRTPGCGSSTARRSPPAPTSSWSARHDELRLRRAADRHPGGAARRRADRRHARRDVPDARRPVAGHRRRPRGDRGRRPAARPTSWSASPSRRCTRRRATGSGRAGCWRSATVLDVDVAGARRAGLDSALVLTGGTTRDAGRRRPTRRADRTWPTRSPRWCSLRLASPPHGPRRPPDRQPLRRRRPRRAAAARRRGGAALARHRVPRRPHDRRSSTRASWRARRATRGEVAAAMGGDGLAGAVAGELRGTRRRARRAARRPRQRLRAQARHRARPGGGRRRCSPPAASGGSTSPRPAGARTSASLSAGFDSDVNDIANATRLPLGHARLPLRRAARAARAGSRRAGTSTVDGDRARVRRATRWRWRTRACSAAACGWCPTPSSTTGCSTSRSPSDQPKLAYLRGPAEGVQGHARRASRAFELLQRPRDHLPRRPPVHRLRRRRPDRRPARHRPRRARRAAGDRPVRLRGRPARRARRPAPSRALAGRGGTSLPGKVLMRAEPHAIARLAARLPQRQRRRSPPPTARRRRRRWSPRSSSAPARGSSTTAPARTWPAASPTRARGARARRGDMGLFEVDEFWLGPVAAELEPRARAARQPVPRPARPLRRAGDHRRPLGGDRRRPAGARPRSCSTPTTRSSPTSGRERERALLRRRGRRARAARAPARVRLQALPPLRRTPTSTRPPTSRHLGRYALPELRRAPRPSPQVARHATSSCAASARPPSRSRTPDGRARGSSCRCPASTTSTTRSAPPRCACALGVAARRRRRRPGGRRARLRPRRDASTLGGRPTSILLVKNPAGANEVLRTLALEGARARPVRRAQRPHRRRPRRLVGVGRRLGARSPRTCAASPARARAPPSWRCGSSTRACDPARLEVVDDLERGLDRALAAGDGPLYALPTYTALLELRGRCSPAAARPRSTGDERRRRSGTTSSAARYAADLPLWRELAARGRRPGARRRRRHRPRRARPRARRPRRHRARPSTPSCSPCWRERADGPAGRARVVADAAGFDARRGAFALVAVPMQTIQLLPGRAARGFFASRPARASRPAGSSRWRSPTRSRASRRTLELPLPDAGEADGWRYVSQPTAVRDVAERHADRARSASTIAPGRRAHDRADDVIVLARVTAERLAAEGAAAGLRRRRRAAHRRRRTSTSAPRWWCCVAERTLRVGALYPDLLNIYADRGNLLLLERRCAWRGIGFELRGVGPRRRARPRRPRPVLHRRRPGPRPGAVRARPGRRPSATRCTPPPSAAPSCSRVCGGYQLLGHGYELGGERLPGVGLVDLETVREDGPRLIGNVAIELDRRARCSPASRTTAAARTSARARSRSAACCAGHGNDGRSGYEGVRGGPHGTVVGTYLHGPLLPKNAQFADWLTATALGIEPAELAPLDDALEAAAHAAARRAAGSDRNADRVGIRAPSPRGFLCDHSQHRPVRGAVGLPSGRLAGVPGGDQALPRQPTARPSTSSRSRSRAGEICVLVGPVRLRQDDRDADGQPHDRHHRAATSSSAAAACASATRTSCGATSAT